MAVWPEDREAGGQFWTVSVSMELGIDYFQRMETQVIKMSLYGDVYDFLRIKDSTLWYTPFGTYESLRGGGGGGARMIDVTLHISLNFSVPPHLTVTLKQNGRFLRAFAPTLIKFFYAYANKSSARKCPTGIFLVASAWGPASEAGLRFWLRGRGCCKTKSLCTGGGLAGG